MRVTPFSSGMLCVTNIPSINCNYWLNRLKRYEAMDKLWVGVGGASVTKCYRIGCWKICFSLTETDYFQKRFSPILFFCLWTKENCIYLMVLDKNLFYDTPIMHAWKHINSPEICKNILTEYVWMSGQTFLHLETKRLVRRGAPFEVPEWWKQDCVNPAAIITTQNKAIQRR